MYIAVIHGYPLLSTFSLCILKGTIGQEVKAEKKNCWVTDEDCQVLSYASNETKFVECEKWESIQLADLFALRNLSRNR